MGYQEKYNQWLSFEGLDESMKANLKEMDENKILKNFKKVLDTDTRL